MRNTPARFFFVILQAWATICPAQSAPQIDNPLLLPRRVWQVSVAVLVALVVLRLILRRRAAGMPVPSTDENIALAEVPADETKEP